MLSFDELQKKYKDQKPQTVAGPSTEDPLYIKYREAVEAEKPKVAGGTVNPIISFGNVRENPVLKRKTNTTKTYSQALTESRNKAKVLENGAKLPTVIPPKGDVSKLILPDTGGGGTVNPTLKRNEVRTNYDYMTDREAAVYKYYRDRGQVEKAQEYLDALEMDVNQRAAMQKREDAKKLAEENWPVALYARAVGNVGQAAGALYSIAMEGADKPVDPYHPLMGGVNMNEGLYEGLMGQSTGANKVFKDIGLGVFDWGTQAALLGPATPYVMAAGAMAGNTKDALERGGTMSEAVEYGVIGGAAEAATEKLGYDRLFKYGANAIAKKLGHAGLFDVAFFDSRQSRCVVCLKSRNKRGISSPLRLLVHQLLSFGIVVFFTEIPNRFFRLPCLSFRLRHVSRIFGLFDGFTLYFFRVLYFAGFPLLVFSTDFRFCVHCGVPCHACRIHCHFQCVSAFSAADSSDTAGNDTAAGSTHSPAVCHLFRTFP